MLFTDPDFWILFIIIALLYWQLPRTAQNVFLLLASVAFYCLGEWKFAWLLGVSTVLDYATALGASPAQGFSQPSRRTFLTLSILGNLGILFAFKYYDFFAVEFARGLSNAGISVEPALLGVALPLGISFYTFQTLSYTIDSYRGRIQPTRNFIDYALYVSFFPQLIAGPIERASSLLPQVQRERRFEFKQASNGFLLFCWGLFKKIYVADSLEFPIASSFQQPELSFGTYWMIGAMMIFKVYYDFSGYSDMARGLAAILGFDLMQNFRPFYLAKNGTELWQRWHISLTTWARDYVFRPLSSWRPRSTAWLAFSLFFTSVLFGVWHGPSLNWLLFGVFNGLFLLAHIALLRWNRKLWPLTYASILFLFPFFGLLHFVSSAERMESIWNSLNAPLWNSQEAWQIVLYAAPFLVPAIAIESYFDLRGTQDSWKSLPWFARAALIGFFLGCAILLERTSLEPFIYFRF